MNRCEPWTGDRYADDLGALVAELDLCDAIQLGHSTGGAALARHVGRRGTSSANLQALIKGA